MEKIRDCIINNRHRVILFYKGSSTLDYEYYYGDSLIFKGSEYRPSPLYNIDDNDSVMGLLGFLCVIPGDADEHYFKDYTREQLAFCETDACEDLRILVCDYEENHGYVNILDKE